MCQQNQNIHKIKNLQNPKTLLNRNQLYLMIYLYNIGCKNYMRNYKDFQNQLKNVILNHFFYIKNIGLNL